MDLAKTLELHKKWLENGGKGAYADLNHAKLSHADLRLAKLSHADLSYADLRGADLSDADLSDADLSDADLQGADLQGADLQGADLSYADLQGADLSDANLRGADLRGADLSDADLQGADLSDANLNWVNWHGCQGIKVYVAGLQSSRPNAQLAYIPKFDVATTGCWQDTWEATKQRVADVYQDKDNQIYHKYQLAFKYIEDQLEADK